MITVGIDVGSITAKAAVIADGKLMASGVCQTGYDARAAAEKIFKTVMAESGRSHDQVEGVISTGYGRKNVTFADKSVTEITCHAAGANFLDPGIRSVIDIGGQDSKAMVINGQGKVLDFAMNDKCAAGTGRFLEVMARALELELDLLGDMALKSEKPSRISSLCTVFAESEVISLIAKGEPRENIVAGIHASIGSRVVAMAGRLNFQPDVMMTGGVAKNKGLVRMLEQKIGMPLNVSPYAQVIGAIGAALLATERFKV
ncbi:MAG: acyl-CoA dehydratase activase [Deltaproteobacteria bacterium]|nr:acyl-CoA dehydratase activase [Deltaproteobacteria bacterium]